jgi:hypothetical protein
MGFRPEMTAMANANAPFGLRPINDNGTPWSGQGRLVYFPTSQAGNIFLGDPLLPLGGTDAFGVPAVGIASAGSTNTILGGFNGIMNGPAGSGFTVTRDLPVYRQASIANYGMVCDDPNQLYAIQEDSNGGAIAAANAGFANGNLVTGAGGSTVTGFSSWQLQSSTVTGSGNPTYQVKVLGLLRGPGIAIGNYAVWVVRLNLPALWAGAGY